MENVLKTSAYT